MSESIVIECRECGCRNDHGARFCESCGISLCSECPSCGAGVRAQQKFCRDCGQLLTANQSTPTRVRTPKHLAERILNARPAREGERKIATVLFADIAGSTALIRDLDIEEANRILEPTIDSMIDVVHHYEGTITHTAGDGVMAIFGAPIAHEDHALRACCAALDIQEAMRRVGAQIRRDFGLLLQVRVGINSGAVVVKVKYQEGDISVDYRAVGVSTHVAAKLEALAAPGSILLTQDTFALAEGFVRAGNMGEVTVKGIEGPIRIWELHGIDTRMRIHALAARGLSKFVGRRNEMELLERAAEDAKSARGQVVALVGEPGVGKSRLFIEFIHSSRMQDWLVLEAGSVSYGKATSYFPLVDLLTRYFNIHGRDDEQRVRDKIISKLSAFKEEMLLAQTPYFLGTLGLAVKNDEWTHLTPIERQRTMFDALKKLLIRESQKQPLCLVFEDLHWIDGQTRAFLDMLMESIPAVRLLLLVNYRPEYKCDWTSKSYFSQARINPLVAASADEMLDVLLGPYAELAPIKRQLMHVTEGNPLFLEESVRGLVESGVLVGEAGQRRSLGSLPEHYVPRTIEALLASRIDRLQPETKEILQCAAVIGIEISQTLLKAVSGMPQTDIETAVHELQAAEFLYEQTLFPDSTYTFKHAMTREVAYASLLRGRREELHARAARTIVELAGGRLEEHVERVAAHAEQGGLSDMALDYLERAGAKAFALYANAEAVGFFERALKALSYLPKSRPNLERAADLRFKLRNALLPLGAIDRTLQVLKELDPILASLGDRLRSARHAAFMCNHHFLAAEQRRAIEFGESGLAMARECSEALVQGELLYRIAQSYHLLGDNTRAITLLEESLGFTGGRREADHFELSVIPSVVNRTWLVSVLTECGDFSAGITHARRALEIAEECEHPLSQVLGWLSIGQVLLRKGEFDGAIGALERGMTLCSRHALPIWRLRILCSLGVAYAYCGRFEEGLKLAQEALDGASRMRLIVDQPMFLVGFGRASLLAGQNESALDSGKRALQIAVANEAKGNEAWARFLIGEAIQQSAEEAVREFMTAATLATACGALPLAAFCKDMSGRVLDGRGEHAAAKDLTSAAEATYAQLGMRPPPFHASH
jgi:class 3 adenylate cyclase/tetratricopeptide (TPR) repeat protein